MTVLEVVGAEYAFKGVKNLKNKPSSKMSVKTTAVTNDVKTTYTALRSGIRTQNRYALSGVEHFEDLKSVFGADNVKWETSTNTINKLVDSKTNKVYRALNVKDAERYSQGLGLEAKKPNGMWSLDEHLVKGSGRASWLNAPFISTTTDIDVARGFNKAGSNLGIIEIDLNIVSTKALKGYEIYPRVNGEAGLPYHYSIWQQEISVYKNIPIEAIKGFVK